jgi:hypothetical protein
VKEPDRGKCRARRVWENDRGLAGQTHPAAENRGPAAECIQAGREDRYRVGDWAWRTSIGFNGMVPQEFLFPLSVFPHRHLGAHVGIGVEEVSLGLRTDGIEIATQKAAI